MQVTTELHKTLLRDSRHRKEHKVVIAGVTFSQADIVSLRTAGGAFSETDIIGNCSSRQIDLTLRRPAGTIPRQARIQVYTRLVLGGQAAEWLPKGVFYISTRETDQLTGNLTIHGFDAMRRAMDVWLTPDYNYENWPMPTREAVEDIAYRMGVPVDSRTWSRITAPFPVDYPVDENGDMTMTDILEGIAVENVGNWIITDKGELLFLGYGDIPPETHYLVTEHGAAIALGGVKILV